MSEERIHLIVHGRVQGVAFRYYTQDKAVELGVVGWVRNRRDGAVELVAEGDKSKLDDLIGWTHSGPTLARVDRVDETWEEFTGDFSRFIITHTV